MYFFHCSDFLDTPFQLEANGESMAMWEAKECLTSFGWMNQVMSGIVVKRDKSGKELGKFEIAVFVKPTKHNTFRWN